MRRRAKTASFIFFLIVAIPAICLSLTVEYDPYDTTGFNANRETFSSIPNEHYDPFSGEIILTFEDIRLPGNGGLDLVIQRNFSSRSSCNVWEKWPFGPWHCLTDDENTWLGYGWTLHFGRLFKSLSNNKPSVVEMADGSRHAAFSKPSGGHITKDYWLVDLNSSPYTVTLANGTKIYFGQSGPPHPDFLGHLAYYATKVQDINNNEINIYYTGQGSSEIAYVTDSVGRRIDFTTTEINEARRLTSISGAGVSIGYTHTPHSQTLGITFLATARPPLGNPWEYDYDEPTYSLTRLTTPSGGVVTYAYDMVDVNRGAGFVSYSSWGLVQKTTGGTIPSGTWTFTYSQGPSEDYTRIVDPCGRTHKYKFYGYGEHLTDGNMWKIGLPKSKEIVGEEMTTYTWTNSSSISSDHYVVPFVAQDLYIYVPYLNSKAITRDGMTYTTNYPSYDSYGNPTAISETGDKTRTRNLTYWQNVSKNIVQDKPASETVSGGFPGSFTTNYTYDTNTGNLTQLNKYGVVTSYTYYPNGNLRTQTDANSHTTTYEWTNGRISRITNPIYSVSRVINSNSTIASETNGRGYTTSYSYDANLRLTLIDPPPEVNSNSTLFDYPFNNSYKKETRGQFYIYYYNDGFGRPSGTSDIKGIETDIVYKACGPKEYSTSNIGDTIYYDNFNRVEEIRHKDSNTITYAYSNSDVTMTDEAGKNTYFTYNAFGSPDEKLLVSVRDALSSTTTYDYNILGSLTSITQGPPTITRSFAYNTKNFLTSEFHPEKGTTTYTRDNVGNLTAKTDGLGTKTYDYDAINRLVEIDYGPAITFTYDNADNRRTMVNPDSSVTYTYDAANRLTRKDETILGVLYTTQYVYDGNDNITRIDYDYPSGSQITYTYNNMNQVTSVSVTGPGLIVNNITYYTSGIQIGLPQSFRHSNNLVTNLTYNSRNLTTGIDVGTSTLDLTYGYDSRGNMTSMTSNVNASKHLSPGTTAYNHPTNNRLSSTTGGEPSSFTYNTTGDVTSYVNHLGEQYDLQYNNLHNLISYNVHNGPSVATFAYDGDGMRIKKVSSQGTVIYHYDKEGRVISETDQNGNRISDNVYLNGKLVAKIGSAGEVRFYHTDPAGTPLAMTDLSGNVVWRADYRPFGEEQIITETVSNDYQFAGKEKDQETGLHYFGARYMESKIGRFLSPDPVGAVDQRTGKINQMIIHDPQRINYYAYALNNPYKYIDRDGEFAIALAIPAIMAYVPAIITGVEAAVITGATYLAAKAAVEAYKASKTETQRESANAKSREKYLKHTKDLEEMRRELKDKQKELEEAKCPKERKPIQKKIEDLKEDIKGHEKEMRQKWPKGPPKEEQ